MKKAVFIFKNSNEYMQHIVLHTLNIGFKVLVTMVLHDKTLQKHMTYFDTVLKHRTIVTIDSPRGLIFANAIS